MRRLRLLSVRTNRSRAWFNGWGNFSGWYPPAAPAYVVLLARDYVSSHYVLTFLSEPGDLYRIESSLDLVTWRLAMDKVPAAEAPDLKTTVTVAPAIFADPPTWFRVLRLTRPLYNCPDPTPFPGLCHP